MNRMILIQVYSKKNATGHSIHHEITDKEFAELHTSSGLLKLVIRDILECREILLENLTLDNSLGLRDLDDYNDVDDLEVTIIILKADSKLIYDSSKTKDVRLRDIADKQLCAFLSGKDEPSNDYPDTEVLKRIKFEM